MSDVRAVHALGGRQRAIGMKNKLKVWRTGEDGERGGLPCAVDTQQPEAFALVDAQRQPADRVLATRVHLQHHTQRHGQGRK